MGFFGKAVTKTAVVKVVAPSDKETVIAGVTTRVGLRGKLNKVVLAYSGGLDTSVIVLWLSFQSQRWDSIANHRVAAAPVAYLLIAEWLIL
ncbi:Argininosuccinate synthase, chloroplastic [Linum perenne]